MALENNDSNTSETIEGKYKMLVLDLDDTLLRDDYSISHRNKEMLLKAQKMGIKVVLASGRPTPAMTKYAEELKLDYFDSYMISFNGLRQHSRQKKFIVCMFSASRTTYILLLTHTKEWLAKQNRNTLMWNLT